VCAEKRAGGRLRVRAHGRTAQRSCRRPRGAAPRSPFDARLQLLGGAPLTQRVPADPLPVPTVSNVAAPRGSARRSARSSAHESPLPLPIPARFAVTHARRLPNALVRRAGPRGGDEQRRRALRVFGGTAVVAAPALVRGPSRASRVGQNRAPPAGRSQPRAQRSCRRVLTRATRRRRSTLSRCLPPTPRQKTWLRPRYGEICLCVARSIVTVSNT
jgi:hypothetical protein